MKLTVENVDKIMVDCLAGSHCNDDMIVVEGISVKFGLDKMKLNKNAGAIRSMLDELPVEFKDGWSFLNACNDKHGNQWTGLHMKMEALFVLGMGAGLVIDLMPRRMWDSLPGGMPYYQVK